MKLSTILLIGAAGYVGYTLKQKYDAKQAAAAQAATASPPPPQPITDTSNTVTSIQRTVNDPGTNTDDPTLNDQNYTGGGGGGPTTMWGGGGRQGSSNYSSNWGSYRGN